jgi:hypothetical protein
MSTPLTEPLSSQANVALTSSTSPLLLFQNDLTSASIAADALTGSIDGLLAEAGLYTHKVRMGTVARFYAIWDTADDDITQNPQIRVWGRLPVNGDNSNTSPSKVTFNGSTVIDQTKLWVPLLDYRDNDASVTFEMDCAAASNSETDLPKLSGTGALFISPPVTVNIAGCQEIMAAASVVATHSASGSGGTIRLFGTFGG